MEELFASLHGNFRHSSNLYQFHNQNLKLFNLHSILRFFGVRQRIQEISRFGHNFHKIIKKGWILSFSLRGEMKLLVWWYIERFSGEKTRKDISNPFKSKPMMILRSRLVDDTICDEFWYLPSILHHATVASDSWKC